jgi:hypothetical protein
MTGAETGGDSIMQEVAFIGADMCVARPGREDLEAKDVRFWGDPSKRPRGSESSRVGEQLGECCCRS